MKRRRATAKAKEKTRLRLSFHGQDIALASRRMLIAALAVALYAATAVAPDGGQTIIPPSSIEKPADAGQRAHTNIGIFVPNRTHGELQPPAPGGRHAAGPPTAPVSPAQGTAAGPQ